MKQCLNEKKKYTIRLTLNLYLLQKRTVNQNVYVSVFNFFVFICRNYMNDSFRTEVFVRFQPETIACACIYLAARQLQVCSKYNIEFYTNYEFKAISKMDNKVHCKYMYVLTDSDTLFHRFHCQIVLHGSPFSMWMKATYRKSVSLS